MLYAPRYLYTERFEPAALAGYGGALSLLRLTTRFEAAGSSAALQRLQQLCEREVNDTRTLAAIVAPPPHRAAPRRTQHR